MNESLMTSLVDQAISILTYPYWVSQRENKNGSVSLLFFDQIGLRFSINTRGMYLEIHQGHLDDPDNLERYGFNFKEQSSGYIRFTIHHPLDVQFFTSAINDAWMDAAKATEKFGCCHAFMQCSDERKCLHEGKDTDFGRRCWGCMYHWNLLEGRIFYGKNANYPADKEENHSCTL